MGQLGGHGKGNPRAQASQQGARRHHDAAPVGGLEACQPEIARIPAVGHVIGVRAENAHDPVHQADGMDGIGRGPAVFQLGGHKGRISVAEPAEPIGVVAFIHNCRQPGKHRLAVANQPDISGPIPVDFRGIDIDPDHLGVGKQPAGLQHPVKPDPGRYNHVGLGQPGHQARESAVGDGKGVIIWQDALAVVEQTKGDAGFFDKGVQRRCAVGKSDPGAANEQGPGRAIDEPGCGRQFGFIGMDRGLMFPPDGHVDLFLINAGKKNIRWQFQKHRAGPARNRLAELDGEIFRDPAGFIAGGAPFGYRLDHVDLIHFLQRARQIVPQGMTAAEHHKRSVVQIGIGDAGERIGETGTGRDQADAGLARVGGPCMGHHGRGLFVAHVNGPDAVLGKSIQDAFNVAPRQGEHHPDVFNGFQVSGNQMSSGNIGHERPPSVVMNQ